MQIFDRYTDLLEWIESKGHKPTVLGRAPDGAPVVSIKTGGKKGYIRVSQQRECVLSRAIRRVSGSVRVYGIGLESAQGYLRHPRRGRSYR